MSSYGPGPLAPFLRSRYPEVENSTRTWFTWRQSPVRYKQETFFGRGGGVEPEFFEIFTFQFIQGSEDVSLNNPYFIILTEDLPKNFSNRKILLGR